jgi:hypothetical protein
MVARSVQKKVKTSKKSMRWYQRGAMAFVFLSSALLLTVLYLAISKSTITIVAKPQTITSAFQMRIIDTPTLVGDVTGFVREERFTRTKTLTLSGEGSQPIEAKATGFVTLINDSGIPQSLVATTRLLSANNTLFRLNEAVTVPANGTVQAKVSADIPGKSGEVGPTRFTIPGLREPRQLEVYARSESAMTGGVRYIRSLRESDLESAKETLISEIRTEFANKWRSEIPTAFDSQTVNVNLENVNFDKRIGEEVDILTITANVSVVGLYYPSLAIRQFAENALIESTGDGLRLITVNTDNVRLNVLEINTAENTARINGEINGRVIIDSSNQLLEKKRFIQLSESEIIDLLKVPDLIESANVQFVPFWLKRAPRLTDHITIQILEPN